MSQSNQVTLDIDDEEETNITPQHNVTNRQDSVTRTSNRNNLGLGDRLNNVFREIRPLVEHARMVNNGTFLIYVAMLFFFLCISH